MQLNDFRRLLIAALLTEKEARPTAHLHLLYAPELADTLAIAENTQRETGVIWPPAPWQLPKEKMPRVITLDCRRIAAFYLETDPGLDDPLFESSVSQAHAEVFGNAAGQPELNNLAPDATRRSVCGWIISTDSALQIAQRITEFSQQRHGGSQWLRCHDPDRLEHLWPTLGLRSRRALLGDDLIWLVPGLQGQIVCYPSPTAAEIAAAAEHEETWPSKRLEPSQWTVLDRTPLVNDLRDRWRDMLAEAGQPLPADAVARLHPLVAEARKHGLDGEDLIIYVLTAVQLRPGATSSEPFAAMLQRLLADGGDLRKALQQLDEQFWKDHALH